MEYLNNNSKNFNLHTTPLPAFWQRLTKYDHIRGPTPILKNLHWLPVRHRIKYKALLLTWEGMAPSYITELLSSYRPFSHCIDQAGLGAFTAKSGRKHYNPPPLTVMWMNFDSPNFPSFCSLSAIISFQTCSNKCILYVLSFHKCIKIKYKMVNMYGVFRD